MKLLGVETTEVLGIRFNQQNLTDEDSILDSSIVTRVPFSDASNTGIGKTRKMKESSDTQILGEPYGKENSPVNSSLFGEPVSPERKLRLNFNFDKARGEPDDDNNNTTESPGQPAPLTPTANLKMLISAVSPEIRNRDKESKRKELFRKIEEEIDNEILVKPQTTEEPDEIMSSQESEKGTGSRKEKSLGLLCQRFLSKYPVYPEPGREISICLDEVAKELKVERRRIYDIVNVLESVEMVSRVAKNKYTWHGKSNLHTTLAKLKALGEAEGFVDQLEQLKMYEVCRGMSRSTAKDDSEDLLSFKSYVRKDKSLGIMSQRFLMLFLVSKPRTVNLDISAKILIGDPNVDKTENSKFKTKIRRLYDIANILTSLDLIRKVHVTEIRGRKPAFKYIGPDIESVTGMNVCSVDGRHRPSSRHSMLHCVQNKGENQAVMNIMNSYRPLRPSEAAQLRQSDKQLLKVIPDSGKHKIALLKKSFTRHASFDQICQVAEKERTKLYSSSQPSSPVQELNFDDMENENTEAAPVNNASRSLLKGQKHVIFMQGQNQFHVISNPSLPEGLTTYQLIGEDHPSKDSPIAKSIPNPNITMGREGIKSATLLHLTSNQIDAVLRSLKVPVPVSTESKATDTATQSTTSTAPASASSDSDSERPCGSPSNCPTQSHTVTLPITPQAGTTIEKPPSIGKSNLITPSEAKTSTLLPKPIRRTNSDPGAGRHVETTPKPPTEPNDAEVAAISHQGIKRCLSDGQKVPLRALHLQTEFRESPPLAKLPKLSPEALTKDLAADLDLASPLPDEGDHHKPNFSAAQNKPIAVTSTAALLASPQLTTNHTSINNINMKLQQQNQPAVFQLPISDSQSLRNPTTLTLPSSATMIPVSSLQAQFAHPMSIFQGVQISQNGQLNGHPVNVVLPITFTPPHTPTTDARHHPTVFAFPTVSPSTISTLNALQAIPGKLVTTGAKSLFKTTPVNTILGSSIVTPGSTPGSTGPIKFVTTKSFFGSTPSNAVRNLTLQLKSPEGSNIGKDARQISHEGGSTTARRLDMPKAQS